MTADITTERASQVLAEGMAYIRLAAPCRVNDWQEVSDLPTDVATMLTAAMNRKMAGPADGIVSETIGDYTYTRANTAGELEFFTPSEIAVINALSGCAQTGALYSVAMVPNTPSWGSPDIDRGDLSDVR